MLASTALLEQSLWRSISAPRFPGRLPKHVDVGIIGGGITGLTAAFLLKKAGKTVAVFEREHVGSGETGNTSAHVTNVTDLGLTELVKRFGKDAARLTWQGGAMAIDLIETNVEQLNIDCDFHRVPNFVFEALHTEKDETDWLRDEAEAANDLGFAAQFLRSGPIKSKPAVAYANQAIIHPLAYILGLARAVHGDGSFVCEESELAEVLEEPMTLNVNGENVTCKHLVIATHVPLMGLTGLVSATLLQTKLYPYSTYVIGARVPPDVLAPGLYNDTSDPYYYLRLHNAGNHRYAVFGGADHKTGQVDDPEACYRQVLRALLDIIPDAVPERRWSGQVIETSDGLPYIGETAEGQFAATGYTGNGLTFGTLAGLMAHDYVLGRKNPWQDVFAPDRKNLRAGLTTVLAENVDYPVHFILDRLRQESGGVESVAPGDGRVLSIGGKRVAVHRTPSGELLEVSAVCTHMGCLVRWNKAEATWDCPCHGSRFTPEGLVLGGPAEEPLERA